MAIFKTNNSKYLIYRVDQIFFLKLNIRYIDAGTPGVALGADIPVSGKRNTNTGQNAFLQNSSMSSEPVLHRVWLIPPTKIVHVHVDL